MKREQAAAYVEKCFNGEPASCTFACPFALDIRAFMERAQKGRWLPAYKALRNATVFPAIVSVLCPQPCRDHCQRSLVGDEPLAIRDLEAACIRYTKSRKPETFVIPPKTQSVAVVGAGPAGLSAALSLAQKRYRVTVFERGEGWGGALRGHPRFAEFDEDIALQFSAVEADFRFGEEITDLARLDEYDAIFVATGAQGPDFGLKDGWDPALLTTAAPKIFMGGGVVGVPLMESIAAGPALSKTMEMFLQSGRATDPSGDFDRSKCTRYLRHDGAERAPLVVAASPEGYTEEEAKAEAARCFKCDCDACERSCEMLAWFKKKPHKLGLEVYTDDIASPPYATHTLTREVYSCNVCSHCKAVCPVDVDIGELMQFSRQARFGAGKDIPAFHDYWLREMDFHSEDAFFASPPKGKDTCAYAFFPGCKLGAAEPAHVLKSYGYLSEHYDTGIIVGCCGAPAYWAGDRERMDQNADRLRAIWDGMGRPTLVYACAYCARMLSELLPEVPRISLYELLARDESVLPARAFDEATIFDPCAAEGNEDVRTGVRTLAERAGVSTHELREPHRCCGYGGHMRLANPALYEDIVTHRTEASDNPYIVYCANCREVFGERGKPCAHILDLVFSLEPKGRGPDLQTKRDNSLRVKKELMKTMTDTDFIPETSEWSGLNLLIGSALLEELDRKLILPDDLKEAVWRAEQTGEKFYDPSEGVYQCSMVKPVLTYWVQYRPAGPDTYEIITAYSHRMSFSREE